MSVRLELMGKGRLATLFMVFSRGELHVWLGTLAEQLTKAGYSPDLAKRYGQLLHGLVKPAPNYPDVLVRALHDIDLDTFMAAVRDFVRELRSASAD